MSGFFAKYKEIIAVVIGLLIAFISGYWLCADRHRNENVYNHTDRTVERVEESLQRANSRIESAKESNRNAETAAGKAVNAITASRSSADEMSTGITEVGRAVDRCAERGQRIKELIEYIERADKQRTQDTPPATMAK